eukprot:TRINITY_DN8292_c0_g1_i1.p1 TRINITY_DN8292_c0_g1~~TRINITY_DN8292_c0_g1_i1.p1  ORF type:complete len:213 (-),score=66.93 TRINITY_DN8292_c0_g1_i1:371-1009(-)
MGGSNSKVNVEHDVNSLLNPEVLSIVSEPLDAYMDYESFFEAFLEVCKYPPKVGGLKHSEVRESSASSFNVMRRYVSDETGEEKEPELESFLVDRAAGKICSVTQALDGREIRRNFVVLHRMPQVRLEVWLEVDGERRHGDAICRITQGLLDEVLRRGMVSSNKAEKYNDAFVASAGCAAEVAAFKEDSSPLPKKAVSGELSNPVAQWFAIK